MAITILSPHLDDAVLSCWHVLESRDDVSVVNVFTGSPPAGTAAPPWDVLTGSSDPVARMRERHAEDGRALDLVGRTALGLGLLDEQYRRSPLSVADVVAAVRPRLVPGNVLQAPAALGDHPDHALVREAALGLGREGHRVELYADLPHAIGAGWPAWVSGEPGIGDAPWSAALAEAGLDVERLVPRVRALDARARERKLRALAEYRTQRAALDGLAFAPLADPRALAFEVSWAVPASALREAPQAVAQGRVAGAVGEPLHDGC